MKAKKPAKGNTPATAFRLSAGTLAELDWLVKATTEPGRTPETRTSVLRRLIHAEYAKRKRRRDPSA